MAVGEKVLGSKPSEINKVKPEDPEQSKRFIEKAREIGCDEDPKAFDKVFEKVVRHRPEKKY